MVEAAVDSHAIEPAQLTLGADNGTAYSSRGFPARPAELEITYRRGGYRDPESQAFTAS